jgi:hypothetical protein
MITLSIIEEVIQSPERLAASQCNFLQYEIYETGGGRFY